MVLLRNNSILIDIKTKKTDEKDLSTKQIKPAKKKKH